MNPLTLGIDIAKRTFSVALRLDADRFLKADFENTPAGFRKLRIFLQRHGAGKVRAALESTSTYGEDLAQHLHEEGHTVFVVNPERIAHYARCRGQRNKTDPADSVTIAEFITNLKATPWTPPTPEQLTLRSLTRTRQQLVEICTQVRAQISTAQPAGRVHLQAVLKSTAQRLLAIVTEIKTHLRKYPALNQQVQRVMTFKGIGLVTAAVVIAELPAITSESDPREIAAWAGLNPRRRQSGNIEFKTRLSRKGNAHLRRALYMPALVAKRHNPLIQQFAQRLASNGKSVGAILGAISHKMLRILVGMLRSNSDFNPTWSYEKS